MCGIFGVISKKSYGLVAKDLTIFQEMMYTGALRGMDATGVITVELDGDFHIDKAALPAAQFLVDYDKSEALITARRTGVALIGHNRKGTMGGYEDAAAHPFVINNVFAMVHNGTLYGHEKLANTDVDSEALATVLEAALNGDKKGTAVKRVETALKKVDGAYAVVGYNQVDHKIYIVRNSQRPLYIAETEDSFFFASEGGMLKWIMSRNSATAKEISAVPEETLLTFTMREGGVKLDSDKLDVKKPTPVITHTMGMAGTAPTTTTSQTGITKAEAIRGAVSKSEYKRLRKAHLNKKLFFMVTDYVEKFLFVEEDPDMYCVIGECMDFFNMNHTIHCEVSSKKQTPYGIIYIDDDVFEGTVKDMKYCPDSKSVQFFVEDVVNTDTETTCYQGYLNEDTITC